MYSVYILLCADNTLYTGITNDVPKRLAAHRNGTGSRYTRAHGAVRVLHVERKRTKSSALKREYAIKQLSRTEKLQLCAVR